MRGRWRTGTSLPPPSVAPRRALQLLAVSAIVVAACGGVRAPTATPSFVSIPSPTQEASDRQSGPKPPTEVTFAETWLATVETYDARAAEVMIANPLAEWDLVGTQLIDLVHQTRREMSTLASPDELRDEVLALDEAIAGTLVMLEAIEPHGRRTDQAQAFQRALDDWVDHVRPQAEAIRDALGLSSVPPGDLQL